MVHALEKIHRLLKPGGFLVDIHPVPDHSSIEIHRSGKIDLAGHLEVHQWCVDFEQADNALAEIVQRGIFTVEEKKMFDTLTHYDSAAEMDTAIRDSIQKYSRDDQSVEDSLIYAKALAAHVKVLAIAAGPGAELILRESNHISRLKTTY